MDGEVILGLLVIVGLLLVAPVVAFMAMARVNGLARRVAQLEARPAPAAAPPIFVPTVIVPAPPAAEAVASPVAPIQPVQPLQL